MGVIKQILEIGSGGNSIVTEDGFQFNGEFDMDAICGRLEFKLPYYINLPDSSKPQYMSQSGVSLKSLKKFDTVKLFFLEADTDGMIEQKTEQVEVIKADGTTEKVTENVYYVNNQKMKKIFDGFIDEIRLSKAKESIEYEIVALGTLGLANYRSLEYKYTTGNVFEIFPFLLQLAGLQQGQFNRVTGIDYIPYHKLRFWDIQVKERVITIPGAVNLKEALDQIKEKYALIIHQDGEGYVNIMTPFFLLRNYSQLDVNAWDFDLLKGNIFSIDYGDLTQYYNAVVVLGQPGIFGVAVDPLAVSNNGGDVNYIIHTNRSLASDEECQRVARDKLLEIERNYFITFQTIFKPEFMIGQPFRIKDNDRFTGNEILMIKKYTFNIDKQDVSCSVTGFSHGATLIPEDIALSEIGVLDVDILGIRDKAVDSRNWKQI